MNYKPTISQDEPVILARCPKCHGTAMYCIERFLTDVDREELKRLVDIGYKTLTKSLRSAAHADNRDCSPELAGGRPKQEATNQRAMTPTLGGRPIIPLKSPLKPQE